MEPKIKKCIEKFGIDNEKFVIIVAYNYFGVDIHLFELIINPSFYVFHKGSYPYLTFLCHMYI